MESRSATSSDAQAHSTSPAATSEALLRWRAHPAAQRPAQAVLAMGIILVVACFVYITTHEVWFAVVCLAILVAALNRFFFPSRFTIDDEGITASYPMRTMRHRWSELQRFVHDEHGGYLSTRAKATRMDAYRGMHLLFNDEDRLRAIEWINTRLARKKPEVDQ